MPLPRIATIALVLGAIASLALMLNSARNTPPLLIFLYSGRVLLPFVGSAAGVRRWSRRGSLAARPMHIAAVVMTLLALAAYFVAPQLPHPPRTAAVFLIVPLASHIVTAVAYAIAAQRAGKSTGV